MDEDEALLAEEEVENAEDDVIDADENSDRELLLNEQSPHPGSSHYFRPEDHGVTA